MASQSVWGIDIGKSSLKAVRMRGGKDGLEVQSLFFEEYQVGDDGSIPASESSRVLEALIAKYPQMRKERVFVALPGHTSFSRFIKLPPVAPGKVAEMVRFEAQQQIPFPIADVNWDFSLVDREYEDDEDREVGLFAIKKELVYAFLGDLQLSGLEPHAITTSPLAIYNFVKWDMELAEDQATVVLDIGWQHTDLVIVDGQRYWIRNLAINGHDLTKAIAAKLKVGFGDAETAKRGVGESKDKKVFSATELVLKDFVAEIQRSIAFYKAQNKERTVNIGQVLLLGNGSKLPNVRPFFQKELGFPVETVKRLSNLALDVEIENDEVELLKEHLPSFAVAFGLGIQGCGEALNEVNLLPEEIRQRQVLETKKIPVLAAVVVIWIAAICSYVAASKSLEHVNDVLKKANSNLSALKRDKDARDAAKAPIDGLEKQVKSLAATTVKRNLSLEVLNKLAGVLGPSLKMDLDVVAPDDPQKKQLAQGKQKQKVDAVVKELAAKQDATNDAKTWVLDVELREVDDAAGSLAGVRTTLLVARKYVKNAATGAEDEEKTKQALETGVLADLRQVFPKAHFDGAPQRIYNLDKDAKLPPNVPPGMTIPSFCGLMISFDYPNDAAAVMIAAPPSGDSSEAPK